MNRWKPHTIGNKAEAAYRRGDALEKRRAMMGASGAMVVAEGGERGGVREAEWRCLGGVFRRTTSSNLF